MSKNSKNPKNPKPTLHGVKYKNVYKLKFPDVKVSKGDKSKFNINIVIDRFRNDFKVFVIRVIADPDLEEWKVGLVWFGGEFLLIL